MILQCETCRIKIEVHANLNWRFTSLKIPMVLQAVHFRHNYKYLEFPILGKPVKVQWFTERCNGQMKEVKGDKE